MVLKRLTRSTVATLASATTRMITVAAFAVLLLAATTQAATIPSASAYDASSALPVDSCPGYVAKNVVRSANSITADLKLGGLACNTYGTDIDNLKLIVEYQSGLFHLHLILRIIYCTRTFTKSLQIHESMSKSLTRMRMSTRFRSRFCRDQAASSTPAIAQLSLR